MRAGEKLHNGFVVPANAKIFTSKLGREYYVSSILQDKGRCEMYIKFLDGNSPEMQTIPYNEKYL